MKLHTSLSRLALAGLLALPMAVSAHSPQGGHGSHGHRANQPVIKEQKPWGIAGEARQVRRTITIDMSDNMRFSPSHIEVREGETLRLRVRNRGQVLHELVLGTREELAEHAELMKKFPDMEHDEPYMAHVDPAQQADLIWTFNRPGDFWFACLLPGHYEAGMIGTIRVVAATPRR